MPTAAGKWDQMLAQAADAVSLPVGGQLLVAAALVAGLIMWLVGGRLLRLIYALLFAIGGAGLGFFGPAMVGLNLTPYATLLVGAVIGLILGLAMFRLTMAVTLMIVGALGAPVIASAVLAIGPGPAGEADAGQPLTGEELFLDGVPVESEADATAETTSAEQDTASEGVTVDDFFSVVADTDAAGASADPETTQTARSLAERIRDFAESLSDEISATWSDLPERERQILLGSAILGALIGLALGLVFPKKAALIGTAFVGSAVWLPSAAWLISHHDLPGAGALPSAAQTWLAVWVVTALIGAGLQWSALRPKADKSRR